MCFVPGRLTTPHSRTHTNMQVLQRRLSHASVSKSYTYKQDKRIKQVIFTYTCAHTHLNASIITKDKETNNLRGGEHGQCFREDNWERLEKMIMKKDMILL